jgi:hypothetical protein
MQYAQRAVARDTSIDGVMYAAFDGAAITRRLP